MSDTSDSVTARHGDTVDAMCHRHYGRTAKVTEAVLEANPGLAELGPLLPSGTPVNMPIVNNEPTSTTVKLWD
ncbi:tail protein X [Marinimicrobium sp. ARAG 43.8]|uniref:tail protein X n=1 Tax=Marinimicrobium sp. ARAG 43.8 TaxID=3418719 RepID=UPI003CF62842